jgi:hypothetical protein
MSSLHRFTLFLVSTLAILSLPAVAKDQPRPRYGTDDTLVLPADYREWVFLSSGLDMSYTEGQSVQAPPGGGGLSTGAHSLFDNVFVDPAAWSAFKNTGHWPDKTVFIMENREAGSKGSINKHGQFQTENLMGLEFHVRDEARFKGGWGFFASDGKKAAALLPTSAACYSCHLAHGTVDTTFTQFYPTAKPIAVKAGTYRSEALD